MSLVYTFRNTTVKRSVNVAVLNLMLASLEGELPVVEEDLPASIKIVRPLGNLMWEFCPNS